MEKKDNGTTTKSLGLRITAMRVYLPEKSDNVAYGKDWGKKVTTETFVESLKIFFHNGSGFRKGLIPKYLEKIRKIQEYMHEQRDVRMYSSSLLFLYDGEGSDENVELKLIDFAHVHEITDGGRDEGYIFGLKNLIEILEKMQE